MGKHITPSEATSLCDNFDFKNTALTSLIKKDDNRSSLFSLTELKNYIDYLENQPDSIDGIRFYLGSYSDTNLTTLFLCPTENGVDNTSVDAYNFGVQGTPSNKKYGK